MRLTGRYAEVANDPLTTIDLNCRGHGLASDRGDPGGEVGYHLQLTETCSESKDVGNPKIINQIEANLANSPDVQTVIPDIERLEEARR